MENPPDDDPKSRDGASERVIRFRLGVEQFGIRVAEIGGVANCGPIREVPGAPSCVLGLTEWRGSLLTVLDLPRLLDREAPEDPACLIRLAPPMEQTAFFLPATVQLVEREPERADAINGAPEEVTPAPDRLRLVRPLELLRRLELEMAERS